MNEPRTTTPIAPPAPVLPTAEYVVGGDRFVSRRTIEVLPHAFDDITSDFGDTIYQRMLLDPQVRANLNVLRTTVVSDGVTLSSAVGDSETDGYDLAAEILAFCQSAFDDLAISIDDTLWDLAGSLAYGSRVAELVYRQEAGKLPLHAVKVKPRRATAFVVDAYLNILGLYSLRPGNFGQPTGPFVTTDLTTIPSILPRDKFAIFSFRPDEGDPRGTSICRPAYSFWWTKQQIPQEYLRYLATVASASVIGFVKNGSDRVTTSDGRSITRAQAALETLTALKNNSAAILGNEDQAMLLEAKSQGDPFLSAFDLCDRQITTGMLGAVLATMEGKYGTRAQAETHGGVLDESIEQIKHALCRVVRRDILARMVAINFGKKATALTPKVTLGSTETPDLPSLMASIALLARANYFHASQLPAIDAMLGLPPRSTEAHDDDPDARTRAADDDEEEDSQ